MIYLDLVLALVAESVPASLAFFFMDGDGFVFLIALTSGLVARVVDRIIATVVAALLVMFLMVIVFRETAPECRSCGRRPVTLPENTISSRCCLNTSCSPGTCGAE